MTPPIVPGYTLVRYLGGGPIFEVWEGRQDDDAVRVAIKYTRADVTDRASALTLLRREARAGQKVRHPRLVRVLKHSLAAPPHHIVLEYLTGESLRNLLRRRGRMGVRTAVWAVRQAAEGVAALHRAGLIHADVKPANILVCRHGEAKVIDLAFAYRPGENRPLLESGFVMGTPAYLAPELCRCPVREGPAADVFALGVTLFECLTGRLPYPRALTADEAMGFRRVEVPLDLTDIPGRWPDRLVELVRGMLATDPRDRPTAARAVRELVQIEIDCLRAATTAC
jgi:serine/threonine-protein kinase